MWILMKMFSVFFFIVGTMFIFNYNMHMSDYLLININFIDISYILFLDWMSLMFMSMICFISSMVLKYSNAYMADEKNDKRFCLLVILFVFSMLFMIISPNLISIFLDWDGLELVSYCLVIYYQNVKSFNAGMLTALTNRIGNVVLLINFYLKVKQTMST